MQVVPEVAYGRGYRVIAAGQSKHTCGILDRWPYQMLGRLLGYAKEKPPEGQFQSVDPGVRFHLCAVRQNGEVACWGKNSDGQSTPPGGSFIAVATGHDHACGLKADQTITHVGDWNQYGAATPPDGQVHVP